MKITRDEHGRPIVTNEEYMKMQRKDDNTWWIGSTDFIKPKRKINWLKILVWSVVMIIGCFMAFIWYLALSRFHG